MWRDMARVRRARAFDHESMRISLCEKRASTPTQVHYSPMLGWPPCLARRYLPSWRCAGAALPSVSPGAGRDCASNWRRPVLEIGIFLVTIPMPVEHQLHGDLPRLADADAAAFVPGSAAASLAWRAAAVGADGRRGAAPSGRSRSRWRLPTASSRPATPCATACASVRYAARYKLSCARTCTRRSFEIASLFSAQEGHEDTLAVQA